MVINTLTAGYMLLAAIALALGLGGAVNGWLIARRWRPEQSSEEQYALEKRVYLVLSLVGAALWTRLVLVPVWFWTVDSLKPEVPGAMCLTGVHMLRPGVAFTASALKLVVPALYGYWLVLNALDRQFPEQPFMTRKLRLLFPVGLLLLVESYCDLRFLTSVKPRLVACCTSIFDRPTGAVAGVLSQTNWRFTALFLLASVLTVVGLMLGGRLRPVRMVVTCLAVVAAVGFVLALHAHLCPTLLHAPFHHCVFCVWQELWDIKAASIFTLLGLSLAAIYGTVAGLPRVLTEPTSRWLVNLVRRAGAMLLALGLLILCGHLAVVVVPKPG